MLIRLNPRVSYRCMWCSSIKHKSTSTALPESLLIQRLRSDLKSALIEKNTSQLNVIRGILADIVHTSKVNSFATTDKTVYSVMELRIKQAKTAAAEFENAKRDDLKEKEDAQINILQAYLNEKETFTDEEISNAAIKVMRMIEEDGRKVTMGKVISGLVKIGGPFDGKPVEMATVTRIVRNLTSLTLNDPTK